MQCTQCQAEIPENQNICPACGREITNSPSGPTRSIPSDPIPMKQPVNAFKNFFVALVVLMLVFQFFGLIISVGGIIAGAYLDSLTAMILVILGPIMVTGYIIILYHKKWGVYLLGITVLLTAFVTYWESGFNLQNIVGLLIPGLIIMMAIARWGEFT